MDKKNKINHSTSNHSQPEMTVQDKGGKGLWKDGAKRHRKVLRDNIQSYHPVFGSMWRLQKDLLAYI